MGSSILFGDVAWDWFEEVLSQRVDVFLFDTTVKHPLFADVFERFAFSVFLAIEDGLDEFWEVVVLDGSVTISLVGAVIEGSELVVHASLKHADAKGGLKDEDEGSGSIGTAPAVAVNGLIWGSVLEDLDGSLKVGSGDVVPKIGEGAKG